MDSDEQQSTIRQLQETLKKKRAWDRERKDLHYRLGELYEKTGQSELAIEQFKVIYEEGHRLQGCR